MAASTTKSEVGSIFLFITIAICCCCSRVYCQYQQQQQQEPSAPPHKYQQMQYQMQQQQQYEYQQHLQQQQQQQMHYQQQYQQQQQLQQKEMPAFQPQQKQQTVPRLTPTQTQMLKTGASLVVDDNVQESSSAELISPKEYFTNSDATSDLQTTSKRRPGTRKRKRRPQLAVRGGSNADLPSGEQAPYWRGQVDDDPSPTTADPRTAVIRKRKQPAVREPLAALEKEQKLYEMRDKQRHEFVSDTAVNQRDKSYRRPYSQAKKDAQAPPSTADTPTTHTKNSVDLRNILKSAGGLSLSEILQQKNLSLDDLLNGKQNALLALQTTAAAPAHKTESNKPGKPIRRVPYPGTVTTMSTRSEELANSRESDEKTLQESTESDDMLVKSKQKLSALQRLKLFGSQSRATTLQSHNGELATKRREPLGASTPKTTSTTTTTTTRVPIYKKRQQLRPTLKSPLLFKAPPPAITTKEVPTSMETLTTTNEAEGIETEQEEAEVEEENEEIEETEKYLKNETNEESDDEKSTTTTTQRTTSTRLTTTAATKTTIETTTSSSSSDTNNLNITPSSERKTQIKLNAKHEPEQTLKTNSIEALDERTQKSAPAQNEESDNLENFFEETNDEKSKGSTAESITSRIDRYPTKPTSYLESVPDLDGIDDRTDLLELIEDRRSGNRLFKVLEQRNMTLEELIEHRKRGSSQLHLSTIVQNHSRFFPGQKVVLNDNMDIVTAFENFPHFNLMDLKSVKPDDIKTDSQGSSYFTSIIDIEPTDEIYKDVGDNGVKGSKLTPPQRLEKSIGFFPSWKTLALASLATTTRDASTKRNPFFLPQPQLLLENSSAELDNFDLTLDNETNVNFEQQPARHSASIIDNTVEEIENEVARAHDLLDLELSGHGFKRSPAAAASMSKQGNLYTNMPAGIRSAIVASAAIVLTSLATFMVIFVVCRWKQRRRRKTNYMKTYNAMKSKLPTVANTSRRSSLRNMEEMVGGISTVSVSPVHQLQRQSSLLFPRRSSADTAASGSCASGHGGGGGIGALLSGGGGGGGMGSATGSTTSLALSLQSVHNLSTTKLNTMDPNSPEVQEYLFDKMRKSF